MVLPTDSESRGCGLLYKEGRRALRHSVTVQFNVRMGKTSDLSEFERGMIVGARCTSSYPERLTGAIRVKCLA
jgi:hypothetical protein